MSFTRFIRILLGRWRLIAGALVTTVLLAVVLSLVLPKEYTGYAEVIVDTKATDPVMGMMPMPSILGPAYVATQADLIQSERVARSVVDKLDLTSSAQLREQWQLEADGRGDFKSWIARLLLKKVKVKPTRAGNIISITYSTRDPSFAAIVANAFAQSYVETTVAIRADPAKQMSTFFDAQTKEAREALESTQRKLSDYQRDNRVVVSDERFDVENQRLAELTTQYTLIQAVVAESRSKQGAAARRDKETLDVVVQSPLIQGLKSDIARAEGRLQETVARLGTSHPQYLSARAELNTLREKLANETVRLANSISTTNSVNDAREAQLRADLEAQRTRVLKLKAQRDDVAMLQKEVDAAQKRYDLVTLRQTQTNIEGMTRQSDVSILTPATEPTLHSFPRMTLNVVVAILLGGLLGVGLAMFSEIRRPKVHAAEDIVEEIGMSVLGVVPSRNSRRLISTLPLLANPYGAPTSFSTEQ